MKMMDGGGSTDKITHSSVCGYGSMGGLRVGPSRAVLYAA